MKKNNKILILGEVALVALFAGGFYIANELQLKPTEVYQFSHDLSANTKIVESDLKKVELPSSAVLDSYVRNADEIVGKYTSTKVFANENVMDKKLIEKDDLNPLDSADLSKLRKVSFAINYTDGLGGNLKSGDKVDLIYTAQGKKNTDGSESTFNYSKVFMQDVIVYSVTTDDGYKYEDKTSAKSSEEETTSEENSGGKMSTITVAVTLEQAEEIKARLKSGTVNVVGRFEDSQNYDSTGYIVGDYDKVFTGTGLAESNR